MCVHWSILSNLSPLPKQEQSICQKRGGEEKRREAELGSSGCTVQCSSRQRRGGLLKSPTSASERISVLELPRPRGGETEREIKYVSKGEGNWKKRNVHTKVDRGFTCNRPLLRRQRQTQVLKNRLATGWKYVATRKCSGKKGRLTHLSHMGMSFLFVCRTVCRCVCKRPPCNRWAVFSYCERPYLWHGPMLEKDEEKIAAVFFCSATDVYFALTHAMHARSDVLCPPPCPPHDFPEKARNGIERKRKGMEETFDVSFLLRRPFPLFPFSRRFSWNRDKSSTQKKDWEKEGRGKRGEIDLCVCVHERNAHDAASDEWSTRNFLPPSATVRSQTAFNYQQEQSRKMWAKTCGCLLLNSAKTWPEFRP